MEKMMTLKSLMQEDEESKTQVAVKERTKEFLKLPLTRQEAVLTAAVEYETMNQQEKLLAARRNKFLRPIIEGAAHAYGVEDQDGHMHLVMEKDAVSTEVIRTKKISRTLNTVAAESLLKEKGLYESCVMQVISWEIDEEKIIEAYNAGKITAGELDDIFSEKISWATSVKTGDTQIKEIEKIRKEIEKMEVKEMTEIEST
jgi:hypothetical protein